MTIMPINEKEILKNITSFSNISVNYFYNACLNMYYLQNPDKAKLNSHIYKIIFIFSTFAYLATIIEKAIELKEINKLKKYSKLLKEEIQLNSEFNNNDLPIEDTLSLNETKKM